MNRKKRKLAAELSAQPEIDDQGENSEVAAQERVSEYAQNKESTTVSQNEQSAANEGQQTTVNETPAMTASERDQRAFKTVRRYVWWSAGAGLIPVMVLDGAAVAGVQLKMLADLSKIYDVPFQKNRGKAAIATLGGFLVPHAAAFGALGGVLTGAFLPVASLVKGIPVVGPVAGAPVMAAFSAAYAWALGNVFLQHFASGGTFLDFDAEKVKEYFKAKFSEGRQLAAPGNANERPNPA